MNLPSSILLFSDSNTWFDSIWFRIDEKSFPTSKVGYLFVFLKSASPGSLNASIETMEKSRVKARSLFIVKDQEDMKLQLSEGVFLYDDRKHEKNTAVAHFDS